MKLIPESAPSLFLPPPAVLPDEPCYWLSEENLQSHGSRGWRRYQRIKVIRNDLVVEYRRDLGPARRFKADQFQMPGGVRDTATGRIEIFYSVAELQEAADQLRDRKPLRERPPLALWEYYQRQQEQKPIVARKQSQFGPSLRVIRS